MQKHQQPFVRATRCSMTQCEGHDESSPNKLGRPLKPVQNFNIMIQIAKKWGYGVYRSLSANACSFFESWPHQKMCSWLNDSNSCLLRNGGVAYGVDRSLSANACSFFESWPHQKMCSWLNDSNSCLRRNGGVAYIGLSQPTHVLFLNRGHINKCALG